jgi:hypothetical protein
VVSEPAPIRERTLMARAPVDDRDFLKAADFAACGTEI